MHTFHRVGRLALVAALFLASVPPAQADDASSETVHDPPARLIVGLRSAPTWLEPGDTWLGGEVVRVDRGLHFVVVNAPARGAFEARAKADDGFRYVEEDRFEKWVRFQPNDPLYEDQYGPGQTGVNVAWDTWTGSTAKTVCIVDTGIRADHEDFVGGRYVGGYDYVRGDSDPNDENGHGTHVAGTAAASINNGKGVAGMANVKIRVAKVLDASGSGYFSDVASGINLCASNDIGVISLSLGASSGSTALANAVNGAWDAGSLVVAAAGNDGCYPCVNYPAAYGNAMAVACTTSSQSLCGFSSRGPEVDIAAPGSAIISTWSGSSTDYATASGTSMSTPHVSGIAALIWSLQPDLTNVEVREALETTATDLGSPGVDTSFGHGLVNAVPALDFAYPTIPLTEVLNESFEDGVANDFTLTGLWHVSGACDTPHSPPNYLGYNKDSTCDYDTLPNANSGTATVSLDLTAAVQAKLAFWHRFEHETSSDDVDQKRVQISTDDGATWATLWLWDARTASQDWNEVTFALTSYVGQAVKLRFHFDTVSALDNGYDGWLIDDVRISLATNWPPRPRAGQDIVVHDADGDGLGAVSLDGSASTDIDGTIASARWLRDGAEVATGLVATASIPLGVSTVVLNLTDNEGGTAEDTIVADVRANRAPTADFSYSCEGLDCTLDATTSHDPDGPLATYTWDLGGGLTATGAVVAHSFPDFAARNVTLVVADAGGLTASITSSVLPGVSVLFETDFDEGSLPAFSLSGLWHVSSSCIDPLSAPAHLAFRRSSACDFNTGSFVTGHAVFAVDLTNSTDARMAFHQIAEAGGCPEGKSWDRRIVDVYTASGAYLGRPFIQDCRSPNTLTWTPVNVNLTSFVGKAIKIHLVFDSSTSDNNDKLGWAIEDLVVRSGPEPPIARAGLDVVLRDADGTGVERATLDGRGTTGTNLTSFTWSENGVVLGQGSLFITDLSVGTHIVTLRVTDSLDRVSEDSVTVIVDPNNPPTARVVDLIESRDIDGNGEQSVAVDGRSSSDADGTIVAYDWLLDDVPAASGSQAVIAASVGEHVLRLRVRDNGNAQHEATALLRVLPNRAPTARAPADIADRDIDGDGVETIVLTDAGSTDPDGTALTRAWYDGATFLGNGASISASFSLGLHAIRLHVTDAGGASDNDTLLVDVLPNRAPTVKPPADVERVDANADLGEPVSLADAGSFDPDGTAITYAWIENGTTLGTGPTLNRTFAVGSHNVVLRVVDAGGGVGEATIVVLIHPNTPPVASANVHCIDLHCWFNASASSDAEGPVTVAWAFGDGAGSSATSIEHVYPEQGSYAWTLTASDIGAATHTVGGTVEVEPEPPRPPLLFAPPHPQVRDQNSREPADRLPVLDVDAAWFEADYNFLYVGLQTRPGVLPVGVTYTVSFVPQWTPSDATWNGTIPASATMSTLIAHVRFEPDPYFSLIGVSGGGRHELGRINGTWDAEHGIAWWQLPVALLEDPAFGSATVGSPRAASSAIPVDFPVALPATLDLSRAGDTTGTAAAWPMVYTTRVLDTVTTFDFEEDNDGFAKETEQVWSEVGWDPAAGAVVLVENKADLRSEVYARRLDAPLTPARSFELASRFQVSVRGNGQPSTPLFLGAQGVAYPHLEPNVARIGYRDVVVGQGTYTFQVRDASGVSRMLVTAAGPENAFLSLAYDAPTRTFTMTIEALTGAMVAQASATLPAGSTFAFGKIGVSSDGAPGAQQASPMVAHVDDIALRLRT